MFVVFVTVELYYRKVHIFSELVFSRIKKVINEIVNK